MKRALSNRPIIDALVIILFTGIIGGSAGMLVLHMTDSPHNSLVILDSLFMAVLMLPLLYFFVYRSMKKRDEHFQLFAEYTSDWEYWQDEKGFFLYMTPSVTKITGYDPGDFYSDKEMLVRMIHPDDMENWTGHVHEMSSKGTVEPIEFRIRTRSGDIRWVDHVCRQVYDSKGKKRGVRGSNRDITARKALQDEIKVLKGFLPICASCKKIRDDKGYWNQIESYLRDHSEVEFSHGICPDCVEKLYPGLIKK